MENLSKTNCRKRNERKRKNETTTSSSTSSLRPSSVGSYHVGACARAWLFACSGLFIGVGAKEKKVFRFGEKDRVRVRSLSLFLSSSLVPPPQIKTKSLLDIIQINKQRVLRRGVVRVVGRDDVSDELLPQHFAARGAAVADRRAEDSRADLLERFLVLVGF